MSWSRYQDFVLSTSPFSSVVHQVVGTPPSRAQQTSPYRNKVEMEMETEMEMEMTRMRFPRSWMRACALWKISSQRWGLAEGSRSFFLYIQTTAVSPRACRVLRKYVRRLLLRYFSLHRWPLCVAAFAFDLPVPSLPPRPSPLDSVQMLVFNLFSAFGYHLADALGIPCLCASPGVPPRYVAIALGCFARNM